MATHRKGPGPAERRYCHVQVRVWTDEETTAEGLPPPHPFTLWQYLLTSPFSLRVPGVIVAGRAAMAEALDWDVEDFDRCFAPWEGRGMAMADWRARLVYLPKALLQPENQPAAPPTAIMWRRELANAPECTLLRRIVADVRAALSPLAPAFLACFDAGRRLDLPAKLERKLPTPLESGSPALAPAPALALSPEPDPPLRGGVGGGAGKSKVRRKAEEQVTFAELAERAPKAEAQALEPAASTPLNLRAFMEALAATAGGRFQVSHKYRPRERRNGAAEEATLGLPQQLWDRLRAELAQERPTLEQVRQLGHLLAARDARGRPALWGHWEVVTPDNLLGRLHEALTNVGARVSQLQDLPEVTAPPNTPEYYAQLRARTEAINAARR